MRYIVEEVSLTDFLLAKIKDHPYGRIVRNLTLVYKGDSIVLHGKTNSFYHKQMVQEIISKDVFAKNLSLDNKIVVAYEIA